MPKEPHFPWSPDPPNKTLKCTLCNKEFSTDDLNATCFIEGDGTLSPYCSNECYVDMASTEFAMEDVTGKSERTKLHEGYFSQPFTCNQCGEGGVYEVERRYCASCYRKWVESGGRAAKQLDTPCKDCEERSNYYSKEHYCIKHFKEMCNGHRPGKI